VESSPAYAKGWENLSAEHAPPRRVPGWNPTNKDPTFSRQRTSSWQALAGPWPNADTDPAP
jgi:hypothetical protein